MINKSLTPAERAKMDNAASQAQQLEAKLDYIAMMTDVEIPTEEGIENESEI